MRAFKLAIVGLVVALSTALFAPSAQAAPTRLPTSFNPQKHVYVMPGTNVSLTPDIEQRLISEAAQQNLHVFVVYTLEGDEALTDDFGTQCTTKLLQMWSVQQGFPADNFLLIICVQDKLHADHYVSGAAIGTKPLKLGLKQKDLDGALDKNKGSLSLDPGGFALFVVRDINNRLDELQAGNGGDNGGSNGPPASTNTWLIIGGVVVGLVIVGVIIFIFVRKKQKAAAHKDALEKLEAVNSLNGDINSAKGPLTAAGLSFTPYEGRLAAAAGFAQKARGVLETDPEQASRLATDAVNTLTALLSDMRRAVELKNDKTLDNDITAARKRISDTRTQEVVWNYPGVKVADKTFFLLNEAGHNPDDHVSRAVSELAAVLTALNAGNVPSAQQHYDACRQACSNAVGTVTATLSAKQRVETSMPTVLTDTTEADKTMADQVKKAYLAQQFNTAAQLMDALKQLIVDRREAKAVVSRCGALSASVKTELRENDRYVSYETTTSYDQFVRELVTLTDEVKLPTGNWAILRSRAESVERGFRQVQSEITSAKVAFDNAREKVRGLRRELNDVNPPILRLTVPSREKMQSIEDTTSRLEREMTGAKKDWSKIASEAGAAVAAIGELKTWFAEDSHQWDVVGTGQGRFIEVVELARYSRKLQNRLYNAGVALVAHDPQFASHKKAAEEHSRLASHYWARREWVGMNQELSYLSNEVIALNLIGWWNVALMMRDSDDLAAQHYAFQMGYRENVTLDLWRDKFVSKQRLTQDGLWLPVDVADWLRTGAGGADFTKAPDFKGFGGTDPWTPPTPTNPPAGQ